MEKKIIEDIQKELKEVVLALEKQDITKIENLSNHTIHNASIYQDALSLTTAVLVYALSKIVKRCSFEKGTCNEISFLIKNVINSKTSDELSDTLKKLSISIVQIDKQYKLYVQQVVTQARIKKGSALFRHGISIAHAADLLKLNRWDLQTYIGQTKMIDYEDEKMLVRKKYKAVREIFP